MDDHRACPKKDDCDFWQIFGGEVAPEPLFCDGYAAKDGPVYPFPATARTCKRHPNFPNPDVEQCEEHHGVFDTLIPQFVYELVSDPLFPHREQLLPNLGQAWASLPGRYDPDCPTCGQGFKPAPGVYAAPGGQPGYAHQPIIGRATHVGINRDRGVAEDRILFTQETIQPTKGVSFWARVVLDTAHEKKMEGILRGSYRLGRGQSRGMGEVGFQLVQLREPPALRKRVERFNTEVKAELDRYGAADDRVTDSGGTYFSLTLRSDALLTRDGLPASRPTPEDLGLPAGVIRLRSWARTTVLGGWHSAARLPYRTRQGVGKGAVYLFYTPPEVDEKELMERLAELDLEGIGEDRQRGHGQVTVCAPFHYRQIVRE
jgi:CRISPR-associated protein Csx10